MRVLFLGKRDSELVDWLKRQGEDITATEEEIAIDKVQVIKPDIIVSYNYKYILPKEIIDYPGIGAVNLHISYLPWNRGADPNIWGFIEDTPKGVSIHYLDGRIDTGDIIAQKEVKFNTSDETLKTSYEKLHIELRELFKKFWQQIKKGACSGKKQTGSGSVHFKKDRVKFEGLIAKHGWDTPVSEIVKRP